eukprot:4259021-Alexandrium_andersonii.AAC.1
MAPASTPKDTPSTPTKPPAAACSDDTEKRNLRTRLESAELKGKVLEQAFQYVQNVPNKTQ